MSSLRHITPVRVLIAGALVFAGVEIVKLARERPVAVAVRVACSSDRRDAIRVLFVGNSHTFVNDLPGALCGLGAASTPPVPLDVTEAVAGGYSLADHLRDGTAARLIDEGRWDWVVLQEQSLQ
ncbi:MAG TPA: hypothetical protein VLM85_30980, partial [Polyangiaceae bacterium]|nr:hypothetical protein [Polyangiaceae bacterium]